MMKVFSSFLGFLLLLQINSFAQTSRAGSFVALNPGIYPISGDATISNSGGTLTVDFLSNFSTIQGITLEVFLGKTKNLNLATDVLISTMPLDFGSSMGTPINGPLSFNVPPGVNLYDYDNILIQCTSANVLWGHANLCTSNLVLMAGSLPSDVYRGELTVSSSSSIDALTNSTFQAENEVNLIQGFEAQLTSEFLAQPGPGLGCIIE